MMIKVDEARIAIVGLGYVGLPLAVEFGKKFPTVGYDINKIRIEELKGGNDKTLEVPDEDFARATHIEFTNDVSQLANCNVYIITVPTPIDDHKSPNLEPLKRASEAIGRVLEKGNVVIYESTVYPGATEEICVPLLEKKSNLKFTEDFSVGYSPERINPGDKEHRLVNITKITSGSCEESAFFVDVLYKSIVTAGTYLAPSIRVAEAAKVIENTQRDVNIALINELAMIFNKMSIDTEDVLKAAGTKWNFLPFRPGLVGGHCIGVDPYYLTHKAQVMGYNPEMILAGRRINDGMGAYVANQMIRELLRHRINVFDAKILLLGLTFKENCPDLRNTRVVDIIKELEECGVTVDVYDPWVDKEEALSVLSVTMIDEPQNNSYDGVIVAVSHDQFREGGGKKVAAFATENGIVFDLKYIIDREHSDIRL